MNLDSRQPIGWLVVVAVPRMVVMAIPAAVATPCAMTCTKVWIYRDR